MRRRDSGPWTLVGCAGLLVAMAWLVGFASRLSMTPTANLGAPAEVVPPANFALFDEAWRYVRGEFYGEQPPESAIAAGAIEGLLASLDDPYAVFVDSESASHSPEPFGPHVVASIGAWIEATAEGGLAVAVLAGSPAEDAGLRPHDVLLAAGDEVLVGQSRARIASHLGGPNGTDIVVAVRRGQRTTFTTKITRSAVTPTDVQVLRPAPRTLYLRVTSLQPAAIRGLEQALQASLSDVDDSLILDLRGNPGGGGPEIAADAAGLFFSGTVCRRVNRDGSSVELRTNGAAEPPPDLPARTIVLVNAGTADAAETLAAALRDNVSATLVGTRTFGKGSIQDIETLSDGSLLRITVARWLTSAGVEVDGVGLLPDIVGDSSATDREAGRDRQLEAAIATALGPAGDADG